MSNLIWITILYLLGATCIVLEIFLPGAIVGIVGGIMVITSISWTYIDYGRGAGGLMTIASIAAGYALFRYTLRRFTLTTQQLPEDGYVAFEAGLDALLGQLGQVTTPLHPVGTALFGERRVTVISRGELISPGTSVEVIKVEGNKVLVREHQPRP